MNRIPSPIKVVRFQLGHICQTDEIVDAGSRSVPFCCA